MRLKQLRESGVRSWSDVIDFPERLPVSLRESLRVEIERCLTAHGARDIAYFVDKFHPTDKWRILAEYREQVSFFDIETAGLEYDARITVISCWHRGEFFTFVEHENLDDFLVLLDDVELLGSFNGSSFDVPRPSDLTEADGELAIRLWTQWEHFEDRQARDLLVRYCCADVLLLLLLTQQLTGNENGIDHKAIWSSLPTSSIPPVVSSSKQRPAILGDFGSGSPNQLRARRKKLAG